MNRLVRARIFLPLALVALLLPARPACASAPIADNSFLVEEAYNQEARIVQHIGTWMRQPDGAWDVGFTQEWPLGGPSHQLSYTVPLIRQPAADGAELGLGDVSIHYRLQAIGADGGRLAFAPRFSVSLWNGDPRRGLGAGSPGAQVNLPLSVMLAPRWVAHTNAGATLLSAADYSVVQASGAGATPIHRPARRGLNFAQSLVWLATPRVNFLLELAWDVSESRDNGDTEESFLLAPGVRWAHNFSNGLQIVPGVAVPIGLGASRGEHSLFLYLSGEHGF